MFNGDVELHAQLELLAWLVGSSSGPSCVEAGGCKLIRGPRSRRFDNHVYASILFTNLGFLVNDVFQVLM